MKRQRLGFTLVELLVVIGIIAVLISVLLPALNRARQQAVSVRCVGNLRQIGMASLMYAQENKGQFPCGSGGGTIEKLTLWATVPTGITAGSDTGMQMKNSIRLSMARLLGFKYTPTSASAPPFPAVKVFYCEANDQRPWEPENFLAFNTASGGQDEGKFRYWWTANPYDDAVGAVSAFGGDADAWAATKFWDIDGDGRTRAGVEYLRTTKDKHASEVAICVDQSKQSLTSAGNPFGGWYFMHGSTGGSAQRGWKNELFGDGHAESRRGGKNWDGTSTQVWGRDEVRPRWALANPAAW